MAAFPYRMGVLPRSRFLSSGPHILLIAAVIFSVILSLSLSPAAGVMAVSVAFGLMSLPGIFVGMTLFGWNVRRHPESLILGTPLGIMVSGYVALMVGYLIRWSALFITIALIILAAATALLAMLRRRTPLLPEFRTWTSTDYCVLGVMGLAVTGFVAIPFSRIGALTPDGHAYTWLFGFDFILRAAYAASITMGLPLEHIHMAGVPLHMYLVGYILPAYSYSLCRETVHLQAILLVTEILLNFVFVACLLAFWRLFAHSAKALLITAVLGLAAYSYYGWFVIFQHISRWLPARLATTLQSQFSYGEVSHLYQRLFMVEPQAILALSIFLVFIILISTAHPRTEFTYNCLLGLVIGIEFGIDSWLGLTLMAWFAGVQLTRLWKDWGDRELWFQFLLVSSVAAGFWTTFFMVHMLDFSSGGLVSIRPNGWALKFGLLQYGIEYGPMLPFGLLGLRKLRQDRPSQALCLALIAILAVSQDLFVSIAELPRFRMGNRLLPIALLAGSAWLFEHNRAKPGRKWFAAVAIILALPTLATDIRGASNVLDRHETFYVAQADRKACEWIRTHLPSGAIIQSKPDYIGDYQVPQTLRGQHEMSLIPAFAYRRSALGAEYTARSVCAGCRAVTQFRESDLSALFQARDGATIISIARKYNIDYLYVGPFEENQFPAILNVLKTEPQFENVYSQESVHIFRIVYRNRVEMMPAKRMPKALGEGRDTR